MAPADAVMAEPENVIQMWHHKSSDLLIFVCPINTFPVKSWSGSIIHEMKLRNGCLSIIKSTVKWQYWKYWNMYVELRHYNLTVAVVFEPKWLPFSGFLLFTFCHTNIFKRRTEPLHQSMREIMRKPLVLRARGAQLNVFFFCRCYHNCKASNWSRRWVSGKYFNHRLYTKKLISTTPRGI